MSKWIDLSGGLRCKRNGSPEYVDDLMRDTLVAFAGRCRQHFDRTEEQAFAFKESQLHSVLFPALDAATSVVFREHPTRRDQGRKGWIDYWLEAAGRMVLLELKHGYVHASTGALRSKEASDWEKGLNQAYQNGQWARTWMTDERVQSAALGVYVHWHPGHERDDRAKRKSLWANHRHLIGQLDGVAHKKWRIRWNALWQVPRDMVEADWATGEESYLGLSFVLAHRRFRPTQPTDEDIA